MTKDYYRTPSPLGKPILDLFLKEEDYKETCIHTIWHLESLNRGSFNQYSAFTYLWRLGQKTADPRKDLEKTIEYLTWEIEQISKMREELEIECNGETNLLLDTGISLSIKIIKLAIDKCQQIIEDYQSKQSDKTSYDRVDWDVFHKGVNKNVDLR